MCMCVCLVQIVKTGKTTLVTTVIKITICNNNTNKPVEWFIPILILCYSSVEITINLFDCRVEVRLEVKSKLVNKKTAIDGVYQIPLSWDFAIASSAV
jgi:hypothetical protein